MAQLLRETSAYELKQWFAYEKAFGPIGDIRLDYVAALISERITNTNLKKGNKPASVDSFMPKWGGA